ncbi:hypothetical protein [Lacrimispora brassicae]
MVQNTGELIIYIGAAMSLCAFVGLFVCNFVTSRWFPFTNTMGIVIMLMFFGGIILFFVGDSYRKDISKDVMLSYYENNIDYEDLTQAQRKNISVSIVDISNMRRNGADVSKYLPALKKYMFSYYLSNGSSKEEAEYYMESFAD